MQSIITGRKRSLGQGNIFRSVCQEFCPQGGGACVAGGHAWPGGMYQGHAWWGVCMAGGMYGGACMAGGMHGRGCAWLGGMHGGGHVWWGHACLGGCAWLGGMHGRGHACHVHPPGLTPRDTVGQ